MQYLCTQNDYIMKKQLLLVFLTIFGVLNAYAFENGILPGLFTVHSNGMQVRFSQGNLQYGDAGTHMTDEGKELSGTWRFAATQYESIGYKAVNNGNGTWSYSVDKKDGFRDMFHWASSGYKGVGPDYDVETNSKYGDGTNQISKSWWDWGWYNPITNGGNTTRMWRTLTTKEWQYIYLVRTNAADLRGRGTVCGVKGYIFLPDNWTGTPSGAPDLNTELSSTPCDWTYNVYNEDEWKKMEQAGAVFFPISIEKHNSDETMSYYGGYWTATPTEYFAGYWTFQDCTNTIGDYPRYYDANVRLVVDVMSPSAIDQTNQKSTINNQKYIKNGQLFILRDGRTYNAVGQEVK